MMKLSYLLIGLILFSGVALSETTAQQSDSGNSDWLNWVPGYHLISWMFQDILHVILAAFVIVGVILALVLLTGILKWVGYIILIYFVLSFISTLI